MHFESLSIKQYGVHQDREFEFSPGLQVVYGPNEAGKTTLLQLIRDLLCGFAKEHPYQFGPDARPLKALARCQLADQRRFWFSRQKSGQRGQQDIIQGELLNGGGRIDASLLRQLLGRISGEFYEKVFAFSLNELREGGALLAEEGFQQALFGTGLGGLPLFHHVQASLERERMDLFKPHGAAKRPVINDLLANLKDAVAAQKQAGIRPQEYLQRSEALAIQEREARELQRQLDQLRQEQHRLRRFQQALPLLRRIQQHRNRLAALPALERFVPEDLEQYERLRERLRSLEEEILKIQETLEQGESQADSPLSEDPILRESATVRHLGGQFAQLKGQLVDREQLDRKREHLERRLAECLDQLPGGWSPGNLSERCITSGDLQVANHLHEEWLALVQQRQRLEERSVELQTQRESLERQLAESPIDDRLPHLELLLAEKEQHWSQRARLKELQQRRQQLDESLAELLRSLSSGVEWITEDRQPDRALEISSLPVPLVSAVEECLKQWESLTETRRLATEKQVRLREEFAETERQFEEFQRTHVLPDKSQLAELRTRRDHGWRLIREMLQSLQEKTSSGEEQTDTASTEQLQQKIADWSGGRPNELLPLFERIMTEGDTLADHLLLSAELLALRDRLSAELRHHQQRLSESAEHVTQTEQALRELQVWWEALWRPCGILPQPPKVMLEWMEQFRDYQRVVQERVRITDEEQSLRPGVHHIDDELRRSFPDAKTIEQAWKMADQLRDRLRGQQVRHQELKSSWHECLSRLGGVEQQQLACALTAAEINERCRSLAERLDLPATWEVQTLLPALQTLHEAALIVEELQTLRTSLDRITSSQKRFETQLQELLQRTDPNLSFHSIDAALRGLEDRLSRAERELRDRQELFERRTHAERQLITCEHKKQELLEKLREISAPWPVPTGQTVDEVLAQVQEGRERQRQMQFDEHRLVEFLQPGEREELEHLDIDQVSARLQRLETDLQDLESCHTKVQQQVGAARQQMRNIEHDEQPVLTASRVAELRSRLSHAVDHWAPLALLDALMIRARERFEQNHQPRLLARVSELFRTMTGETYLGVDNAQQFDRNPSSLVVQHREQFQRTTEQLSTGTREQLYLAIRLAYVSDYNQTREPLPMVMDDVLVNFDEMRARQTLGLLIELSRSFQIILLTCHRRTVELVREFDQPSNILDISREPFPTSRSPVSTSTAVGRRTTDAISQCPDGSQDEVTAEPTKRSGTPRRGKRRSENPDQPVLFPPRPSPG